MLYVWGLTHYMYAINIIYIIPKLRQKQLKTKFGLVFMPT